MFKAEKGQIILEKISLWLCAWKYDFFVEGPNQFLPYKVMLCHGISCHELISIVIL